VAPDKMDLLFGKNAPTDVDLDDEDELFELLRQASPVRLEELDLVLRTIVAQQILAGTPPLVWQTAQRLRSVGLARHQVLDQLSRALAPVMESLVEGDVEGFEDRYETLLQALPLASETDIERCVRGLVSPYEHVTVDELAEQVLDELGVTEPTAAVRDLIESVIDRMIQNEEIELLAGDIVVDPERLCRGIVLTTRVTAEAAWPPLDTDLAGLSYLTGDVADSALDTSPGRLLQARVRQGEVVVEPGSEPALDTDLVDRIRRAYVIETAENALPISFRIRRTPTPAVRTRGCSKAGNSRGPHRRRCSRVEATRALQSSIPHR
jgi:hypothetical protein